jgi:hypothetical protein
MAFDPTSGALILFGGNGISGRNLNDTWKWDGTSWHALAPRSSPPVVFGASLVYSATLGKLILFGGISGPTPMPGEYGGTWAWDGTNWSEVTFRWSTGRYGAGMAADPEGRFIFLFGGYHFGNSALGDTWTLRSEWSEDTRTPAPPPRAYASLVLDPSGNSMLLFGGAQDYPRGLMGDTWVWGPF